jgi:hypothetical protein
MRQETSTVLPDFRKKWWLFWLLMAVIPVPCALVPAYSVTVPAVRAWLQSQPPPAGWTLANAALFQIISVVAGIVLVWPIVASFSTRMTQEGIGQLGWRGYRFVRWAEVEAVEGYHQSTIRASETEITINLAVLQDPDAFLLEVQRRIPAGVEYG